MKTIFLTASLILLSTAYEVEQSDELRLRSVPYGESSTSCTLDDQFEFVILVDKSYSLNNKQCTTQQQFIANYISALKGNYVNDPENTPSIAYFEFGNKEDDDSFIVNFNDDGYQNNIESFYNKIKSRKCRRKNEGEGSNTALDETLYEALYEFLDNGNPANIQNIIIFSNYQQRNVKTICGSIRKHLNDNNIFVYIINIEGGNDMNQIENPQYYLSCLTNQDLDRVFVTRSKYLEDEQEIDFIISEGINQICSNPMEIPSNDPTYNPTLNPTLHPTDYPTLRPTSNPTLNPTDYPTLYPTLYPTSNPTANPTLQPTNYPTSEPIPSPTKYPTIEPTIEPTAQHPSIMRGICPRDLTESTNDQFMDFVIMIDNSCGLKSDDCHAFLQGVGQIVSSLIDNSLHSRVMLVEFGANTSNFKIIVPFDSDLQTNPEKYIEIIRENAECRDGGDGETDLNDALKGVIEMIEYGVGNDVLNGIIIMSGCSDNKNEDEICNEGVAALNYIGTDVYIINLIKTSFASNVLNHRNAKNNLLCLTNNNNDRVCIGKNKRGVDLIQFDEIINDCLLPAICDNISTQKPTEEPTSFPSWQPSKDPTIEPTISPMSCLLKNDDKYEFVILADNSCGLNHNECKIQLEIIQELVLLIKNNNNNNNPSVAYIEYNTIGSRVVVSLNDNKLQENSINLMSYIGEYGECGGGDGKDRGETDIVSGLESSIDELLNNGKYENNKAIQKIITINNCKNTQNNHKLCNDIISNANNNNIDIYSINIGGGTSRNMIINSHQYKKCLMNGDENRIFSAHNQDGTIDKMKCLEAINQCFDRICNNSPYQSPSNHPTIKYGYYRR